MIPIIKSSGDLSRVFSRSQFNRDDVNASVKKIVNDVRERGDKVLFEYTEKFDGVALDGKTVTLTEKEIDDAVAKVPTETLEALRKAKQNILAYHERQLKDGDTKTVNGRTTGFTFRPVSCAGVYVPGGKAAYPSSVLMCALPAVVAGVKEIIMCTPAGKYLNPLTVAAARECGINKIYKVGGAQAIAAMAFGTESVKKADVITGPGNIYVAMAKKEVFGYAGIDMIAGPSEILIIADETANFKFAAADMLSQAEHDELAMSTLITTDYDFAVKVRDEVERQLEKLPKKQIASASVAKFGTIIVVKNLDEAAEISDRVAPEHLELCVREPEKLLEKINNAGAVFMGNYSPEPLGDYFAGTNHVLPTSGTARFFSGLSVDNYRKRISIVNYTADALKQDADYIINLAETEDLAAHANAIRVRK